MVVLTNIRRIFAYIAACNLSEFYEKYLKSDFQGFCNDLFVFKVL